MGWRTSVIVSAVSLFAVGCTTSDGEGTSPISEATAGDVTTVAGSGATAADSESVDKLGVSPDWNYDEDDTENGPHHWSALCSQGERQSPVDVVGANEASDADLPDIAFAYETSGGTTVDGELFDSGHALQVDVPAGRTITIRDIATDEDEVFELRQFHFHARSEHRFDGQDQPVEVHFVHQSPHADLAVIGVLIAQGATNAAYEPVTEAIGQVPASAHESSADGGETLDSAAADEPTRMSVTVDLDALLPAQRTYYRYSGSLTTPTGPDCQEGVAWHVMSETIEMSPEQIDLFSRRYEHGNSRPITREGADDLLDSRG